MPRKVYVTRGQKAAAKLAVERAKTTGRPVPPAVQKIADAHRKR